MSFLNKPKFYLNKAIEIGECQYPAWIEIRPIWNEGFIPDHRLDQLKEAKHLSVVKMTMCIIGTQWVVIPTDYITERY